MTKWEMKLYEIESYLIKKYGCDAAYRMISPLLWYLNTGRANVDFLNCFYKTKSFVIGRILAKDNGFGSYEDTVNKIKERMGLQ